MLKQIATALVSLVVLSACAELTSPGENNERGEFLIGPAKGLEFSGTISKATIRLGETATLRFVLRNGTSETVRITFSSGCQILPFVTDLDGDYVHPRDGAWACTAAITNLTIAPGEQVERTLNIVGGTPQPTNGGVPLSPGRYIGFAELGDDLGRSNEVLFEVVQGS